ncbi:MAG: hypothetical protein SFU98_21525 [Leptospiraceae bacterium]|nr:hypothetical protein [Leptospiraceae bacterium]
MRNKLLIAILLVLLSSGTIFSKEMPSAGEMFVDMLIVRPLGIVSTVGGIVLFVIPTPFYFFAPNPKISAKNSFYRFVGYPAQYTFVRPIGEFPGYMETREFVEE